MATMTKPRQDPRLGAHAAVYGGARPLCVGIVGAEAAKFTRSGEREARQIIWRVLRAGRSLLPDGLGIMLVSGGCHLGGVDIWAEEEAGRLGLEKHIHLPKVRRWAPNGYEARNKLIAEDSVVLHNIVVARYADAFTGRRFPECYHCDTDQHVKSGGCWTANLAERLGTPVIRHVVANAEGDP